MTEGEQPEKKIDMSLPPLHDEAGPTEVSAAGAETPVGGVTRLSPSTNPAEAVAQAIDNPANTPDDIAKRIKDAAQLASAQQRSETEDEETKPSNS